MRKKQASFRVSAILCLVCTAILLYWGARFGTVGTMLLRSFWHHGVDGTLPDRQAWFLFWFYVALSAWIAMVASLQRDTWKHCWKRIGKL